MIALTKAWIAVFFSLHLCEESSAYHEVAIPFWQRARGASQRNRQISSQPEWDAELFSTTEQMYSTKSGKGSKSMGKTSSSSSSMSSSKSHGSHKNGKGSGKEASKEKGKTTSSSKGKKDIFSMKERPKENSSKDKKGKNGRKKKKHGSKSMKGEDTSRKMGDNGSKHRSSKRGSEKGSPHPTLPSSERHPPTAAPTHMMPGAPTNKPATPSPPTSGDSDDPTPAPQAPTIPSIPSTPAPTPVGDALPVSPFSLEYTFEIDRRPLDPEIAAAVSVTRTYLNGFAKQRVDSLKELDTRLAGTKYVRSTPFQVNYTATAFIRPGAFPTPTTGQIDLLIALAFSGDNLQTYIGLLRQLPDTNVFSTTLDVFDVRSREGDSPDATTRAGTTPTPRGPSKVAIGASVGAGAFVALLLGIGICRRRERYDEVEKAEALVDGHVTVAGETYVGNSTIYSASEATGILQRARYPDDNQSEWALSTRSITEDGSESRDPVIQEYSAAPLEDQLNDYAQFEPTQYEPVDPLQPVQPMQQYDDYDSENERSKCTAPSSSGRSEDGDVPVRVVDLIKRFSPL